MPEKNKAILPLGQQHPTVATLLLSKGIHPKIVSEMLRHSQTGITMDLYSHILPTMQQETTAAMEAILQGRKIER